MSVEKVCPMCKRRAVLELSAREKKQAEEWGRGEIYLQDIELNAVEREFLKTGYCPRCQELLFGNGETERICVIS